MSPHTRSLGRYSMSPPPSDRRLTTSDLSPPACVASASGGSDNLACSMQDTGMQREATNSSGHAHNRVARASDTHVRHSPCRQNVPLSTRAAHLSSGIQRARQSRSTNAGYPAPPAQIDARHYPIRLLPWYDGKLHETTGVARRVLAVHASTLEHARPALRPVRVTCHMFPLVTALPSTRSAPVVAPCSRASSVLCWCLTAQARTSPASSGALPDADHPVIAWRVLSSPVPAQGACAHAGGLRPRRARAHSRSRVPRCCLPPAHQRRRSG